MTSNDSVISEQRILKDVFGTQLEVITWHFWGGGGSNLNTLSPRILNLKKCIYIIQVLYWKI